MSWEDKHMKECLEKLERERKRRRRVGEITEEKKEEAS